MLLLEHLPADLDALREALVVCEPPRVAKAAHRIAGTFAALAIDQLVSEAVCIEEAADVGDLTHCLALAQQLHARSEQVMDELSRFIGSFQAQ